MAVTIGLANRTIGAVSHLWSSFSESIGHHLSFNGFHDEIYVNGLWTIKPKTLSTTVAVEQDIYDQLIYEFHGRYGSPEDKGSHGCIFRDMIEDNDGIQRTVTITCYASTSTLSVQGSLHKAWIDNILSDIGVKLTCENVANISSCSDHLSFSSDISHHSPASSTPVKLPIIHPTAVSSTSPSATNSETSTQTVCTCTCTCGLSSAPEPTPRPRPRRRPVPTPRLSLLQSSTSHVNAKPTPAPRTSLYIPVPTIPTSNRFDALPIEHCESVPSSTSPRSIPTVISTRCKSSPKKSTTPKKVSPTQTDVHSTTHASPQQPTRSFQKKKIVVLGDSIPKYLTGRKMTSKCIIVNRCIPGSRLGLLTKLAPIIIAEEQPDLVIIHCATNDIPKYFVNECVDMYDQLVTTILKANPSVQIAASSLTTQKNYAHRKWIKEFNARLRDLCYDRNLFFVDNDNIELSHLAANDGLHLSKSGTILLARNYVSCLMTVFNQDFHVTSSQWRKR